MNARARLPVVSRASFLRELLELFSKARQFVAQPGDFVSKRGNLGFQARDAALAGRGAGSRFVFSRHRGGGFGLAAQQLRVSTFAAARLARQKGWL